MRLRAAHLQERGALNVRPSVDIDGHAIFSGVTGYTDDSIDLAARFVSAKWRVDF